MTISEAFDPLGQFLGTVLSGFETNLGITGEPGSLPNELLEMTGLGPIGSLRITGDLQGGSFTLDDLQGQPAGSGWAACPGALLSVAPPRWLDGMSVGGAATGGTGNPAG